MRPFACERPSGPVRRLRPRATRLPFALLCLVAAGPALAHSPFGVDAEFWSGAWHLVLAPLALAALTGVGVACAGGPAEREIELAGLAGLACFLASWIFPAGAVWLATLPVAVVGASAVAALPPLSWRTRSLAILAGVGAGTALQLDARSVGAAAGAGAAMLVVSVWMLEIARRAQRRLPLALRVVGAWIVALAVLLLALGLA